MQTLDKPQMPASLDNSAVTGFGEVAFGGRENVMDDPAVVLAAATGSQHIERHGTVTRVELDPTESDPTPYQGRDRGFADSNGRVSFGSAVEEPASLRSMSPDRDAGDSSAQGWSGKGFTIASTHRGEEVHRSAA